MSGMMLTVIWKRLRVWMLLVFFFESLNVILEKGLSSLIKSLKVASKGNELALEAERYSLLVVLKDERAELFSVSY